MLGRLPLAKLILDVWNDAVLPQPADPGTHMKTSVAAGGNNGRGAGWSAVGGSAVCGEWEGERSEEATRRKKEETTRQEARLSRQ